MRLQIQLWPAEKGDPRKTLTEPRQMWGGGWVPWVCKKEGARSSPHQQEISGLVLPLVWEWNSPQFLQRVFTNVLASLHSPNISTGTLRCYVGVNWCNLSLSSVSLQCNSCTAVDLTPWRNVPLILPSRAFKQQWQAVTVLQVEGPC